MASHSVVVFASSADNFNRVWHALVIRPMEVVATIVSFLLLILVLIVTIPLGALHAKKHPQHPASAWNDYFRAAFRFYLWAAGIRVEVEGLEHLPKDGAPVLLASNHPSHLDGPVIDLAVGTRRATAMTAPNKFFPWPFSFWFKKIGTIDVARSGEEEKKYPTANKPKRALELMVMKLTKLQKTMLIFPEGHMERSRHPLPFHTGAIRIARLAGVPLHPVTIRGSGRIVSPSHWLLKPGTIRVIFHPAMPLPMEPDALHDYQLINLLTNQLLCRIASFLPATSYSPGMVNACKEILLLHPVTRTAIASNKSTAKVKHTTTRRTR
jgi:1-acyl-sn-glycerol-3-phosphate acyltransferase